jgi:hypothetical protein
MFCPVTILEHLEDLENHETVSNATALVTPFKFPFQEDDIADDLC